MATNVKVALVKAGVRVKPNIELVWQWLKDNGTHTAKEVATALGQSVANVSSLMGILVGRNMVTVRKQHSEPLQHMVSYYTAVSKMKKYELLPFTEAYKNRAKRKAQSVVIESKPVFNVVGTAHLPASVDVIETVTVKPESVQSTERHILDTLPVRDAYKLYLELHAMFNPVVSKD
jgi:hypothetical protein